MNFRVCRTQFFQRSSLRLIFFSAILTLVYHKNTATFGTKNDTSSTLVEKESIARKPLFWDPIVGGNMEHRQTLPVLQRDEKEQRKVEGELDLEEMKIQLYRTLSGVPFMDIPQNVIPPYSKIECRPGLGLRIPNVVHFIWFGELELEFQQYLSLRSAAAIQRPTKLYLHMDMEHTPTGRHWERLRKEVPCLEIRRHEPSSYIFGREIQHVAHKSDILRMELLYKEGGIYADINAYFVNPMDPLMNNSFVIGKEEKKSYGNSVMLSEPGAPFLELWYENYESFKHWEWNEHSTHLPARLHEDYPDIEILVDKFSIMRPNYRDGLDWILRKNWDLTYNYCVHLYVNTFEFDFAPVFALEEKDVIRINSTYGQLARRALFGDFYFKTEDRKNVKSVKRLECGQESKSSEIPNVVHFIWEKRKFSYHNYLSIRSAARVFKPESIFFHMFGTEDDEEEPFNPLWVRLNHEVPCIIVNRSPKKFMGDEEGSIPQRALKMKLALALLNGGVVLDPDIIMVRSFLQDMTSYDAVVSLDEHRLSNMMVVGKPNSIFLQLWLDFLDQNVTNMNRELKSLINTMEDLHVKVIPTPVTLAPKNWFYDDATRLAQANASAYYFDYWSNLINYNKTEAFTLAQSTSYGQLARLTVIGESS